MHFLFCVLTSAVYIFNDIIDRDRDRLHPQKANRPIASGKISVRRAFVLAVWLTFFIDMFIFFNGKFTFWFV
ncbi:MAG: UbiA family prenyltransferase [bacterium]|nr:UbiA family prenyltransferase [bacterium]